MQCAEKKQSDSCDVWKLFLQENCQQIYPLVPQYLAIPCQYSAYQSINQSIQQYGQYLLCRRLSLFIQ